jgi:hypothetical protein
MTIKTYSADLPKTKALYVIDASFDIESLRWLCLKTYNMISYSKLPGSPKVTASYAHIERIHFTQLESQTVPPCRPQSTHPS